jgi:hypothetical protein
MKLNCFCMKVWWPQILCTHKLCVSGGLGLKYLSSTDSCCYRCSMLSQGTKWSQLELVWVHRDQIKGQFSCFFPPKVLEKQNKTQVLGVDHRLIIVNNVFKSGLRVSAIPTMYNMGSPIICWNALPIELFLPCLPVPISLCRSELQLFFWAATGEITRGGC